MPRFQDTRTSISPMHQHEAPLTRVRFNVSSTAFGKNQIHNDVEWYPSTTCLAIASTRILPVTAFTYGGYDSVIRQQG